MTYPKYLDDSDDEFPEKFSKKNKEKKMNWLKTQDPDVPESSVENQPESSNPSARYCQLLLVLYYLMRT